MKFKIDELSRKHAVKDVKERLDRLPGVASVSTNVENGKVNVDYDATGVSGRQIKDQLLDAGFAVTVEGKTDFPPHNRLAVENKEDKQSANNALYAGYHQNSGHNARKASLGPNTKR